MSQRLGPALADVEAALAAGRYREATAAVLRAAPATPDDPGQLVHLARRLAYLGESAALVALGQRLCDRPSWSAAAEADVGAIISMAGEQDIAGRLLDRAIAIAGEQPAWLYNRSQMHLYGGRFQACEQDLRRAIALGEGAKARWALSKLPAGADASRDLDALQALPPRDRAEAIYRHFAMFNLLDRVDERERAWQSLMQGCAAKRATLGYDAARAIGYLQALARVRPSAGEGEEATGDLRPVFIVGMHRTGTTLLEHLLAAYPQVAAAGELYDMPAQLRWALGRYFPGASDPGLLEASDIDWRDVGQRYLDHVAWRATGRTVIVDKLPSNFANLAYLRRALPQARVLHMRRSPMDTCFSNLKELFSGACPYSYDLSEMADYYGAYRQLLQGWAGDMGDFMLEVDYEELVADPAGQAQRIAQFCGLGATAGVAGSAQRAVNTASSAQVRERVHRRNVGAWSRYAGALEPLRARLAAQAGLQPDA